MDFVNGLLRFHGTELDQEIHVAAPGLKLIAQCGSKCVQPGNAKLSASCRYRVQLCFKQSNHKYLRYSTMMTT